MILTETINKAIRDTVSTIVGSNYLVIAAKQADAPRPTGPYADVDFTSQRVIGWDQRLFENNVDDLKETIEGMREITMSIGFFRDNAIDNARKVQTGLIRESIQDLFSTAGIGLTSRGNVIEITEAFETTWEERATLDILLNVIGTDEDIVRSITSVEIDGAFKPFGADANINFTIDIQ